MAPLQQILTWQGQKIFVAKLKYQVKDIRKTDTSQEDRSIPVSEK